MIAPALRICAMILSLTLGASAVSATSGQQGNGVQVQDASGGASASNYTLGVRESEAPPVDWGLSTGQTVFDGTGDASWLDGVIEGVTQSVLGFSERDGGILNDGLSVGSIKLDSALFSYGSSVDTTTTLLSAFDRFTQDLSAVVPLQATVPLILLIMAAIVFYRRNRH